MKKSLLNIILVFNRYNLSNDIIYKFINKYFPELLFPIIRRNTIELLNNQNHIIRYKDNKGIIFKSSTDNGKNWKCISYISDSNNNIYFEYGYQLLTEIESSAKIRLINKLRNNLYSICSQYYLFNNLNDSLLYNPSPVFYSNIVTNHNIKFFHILKNKMVDIYIIVLNSKIISVLLYPINDNNYIKVIPNRPIYKNTKSIYDNDVYININDLFNEPINNLVI